MYRLLTILFLSLPLFLAAQNRTRLNRDVFPAFGNYERRGWLISPALTYSLPNFGPNEQRIFLGDGDVYDVSFDAKGKLGTGIEVGRYHVIDASRLISYVDVSIGIKSLRGAEQFTAILDDPTRVEPFILNGEGTFALQYATLSANANNIKQLSDYSFIQNSLGLNVDYRFAERVSYNDRNLPIDLVESPNILFQMHYRLGFGYKVSQRFIIIPSVETPILTIHEFDDMKSTVQVFNSRFRPLIFRFTVMMFDNKAQRKCPSKGPKRKSADSLFGMADGRSPW